MRLLILLVGILFVGCHTVTTYGDTIEYLGNGDKIITKTKHVKYDDGTGYDQVYSTITWAKIDKVVSIRIDDDSEYHITYIINGKVKSEDDIGQNRVDIREGNQQSWKSDISYEIFYRLDDITYFED
jgi:hypothetical protein